MFLPQILSCLQKTHVFAKKSEKVRFFEYRYIWKYGQKGPKKDAKNTFFQKTRFFELGAYRRVFIFATKITRKITKNRVKNTSKNDHFCQFENFALGVHKVH